MHWLTAIKGLYSIRSEVFKRHADLDIDERNKFETFMGIRSQYFMGKLADHVNLRKVINYLEE